MCDWRLRIVGATSAGIEACANWDMGEEGPPSLTLPPKIELPREVAEFCRTKVTAWEKGTPRGRATLEKEIFELNHPDLPILRAKVRMIRQKQFPLIKPLFEVRFEFNAAPIHLELNGRRAGDHFALRAKLSLRERELTDLVCHGQSNREIARKLGKSVYTIKAQLHSVFQKLDVRSRSKLIALLTRA